MSVTPEQELPPSAERRAYRVALGFDFGRVRIGVAIGEGVTGSARPLCTLANRPSGPDWQAISQLLTAWNPEILVVGVARHADDSANAITEAALRFSRQLHGRFQLPVATIDERLSSWEAGQQLQTSASKRRRTKVSLDAAAAALILESWFNDQRSPGLCAMSNS